MDEKTVSRLKSCASAAAWTVRALIANHNREEVQDVASSLATRLAILDDVPDNEYADLSAKYRARLYDMSPDDLYHYCLGVIDDATKKIKEPS